MKNFTKSKRSLKSRIALGLLMMFGTFAWAQPTVKVPPTCQVVVTGTGTGVTLGFGGIVGSGGVVIMPDPFDIPGSGGNFTLSPNGTTVTGWSLSGDLSVQTSNVPPAAAVQSAGAVGVLNIESYNLNLRPAEYAPLYPLSDPKWGRSKGRVSISYSQPPCNNSISFEIYKQYTNTAPSWVPPIVGPDCLLPNKVYTYSVDQIASDNAGSSIGFDRYYWSGLPAGSSNVYTSADESSITFTTGSTVSAFTLQCCYGRANAWDGDAGASHSTCVTKFIGATPTEPNYTYPSCLATGSTSFTFTADPSTVSTANVYTWSADGTSWTLTQSGTANANVTVTGLDNNPGTLTLTVTNGSCEPAVFTYEINRNFVSPLTITPSASCVNAGGTVTLSLPTNAQINQTTWSLPSGWNIVGSNSPSSVITVQVPAGTSAGAYTIAAKATNCPSTSISVVVNVRPATPVFVTTGGQSPTCVVRNGGPAVTYTVTASPGATGYSWVFPTGWTPATSTTTTPTISVTPGGSATSGTISVTALGATGCSSTTTNYAVGYRAVTPSAITASCWSFGVAGTTTITVTNAPSPFFGTYTVTSSPSGLFGSYSVNSTTGVITLNTLATASGTYNLTITHNSPSCGSSGNTFPVTVAGNGASVAITANVPGTGNCDQYSVSGAPGGSVITWYVNGTQVFSNGTTVNIFGNTLTLCGSTAPTSVCANVASGGCNTRVCAPVVGTHGARMANPSSSSGSATGENITVYPNPNNGTFFIKINDFKNAANAVITDTSGRHIGTYKLQKGENKIEKEGLAKGTYIILLTIDGKKETRKVIVK